MAAAGRRPPVEFAVAPGGAPGAVLAGSAAGEPMPSALVCADDALALAVVRALAGLAISVPRHVSVVGCGDQPWARHADPPLTSLRIPAGMLGEAAADHVLARLRGEPPGRRRGGRQARRARLDRPGADAGLNPAPPARCFT